MEICNVCNEKIVEDECHLCGNLGEFCDCHPECTCEDQEW